MGNIVKVRDDDKWFEFDKMLDGSDESGFKLCNGSKVNWCSDDFFSIAELKGRIEPWLTSLFQSEHLSLLVGSGLSTAIQYLACNNADNGMGEFMPKSTYSDRIVKIAKESAIKAGRGEKPNFEDYIRVMSELLRGLEILGVEKEIDELNEELNKAIRDFTDNITAIENCIITSDNNNRERAFNILVKFLLSFASRTGTRDRLNIFTTNYDRVIEAGADIAGLHMLDRFVGSMTPIFRSSRLNIDMHYNPPGMRGEPRYLEGVVHYTKLHGSVDWISTDNNIKKIGLPFGARKIDPYLDAPGLNAQATQIITPLPPSVYQAISYELYTDKISKIQTIMESEKRNKKIIYPNATKDRETSEYPYIDLFRDFAAALCRPNNTLVTYGYSFGDDHINRIIKDMLTISSTHLVIIAYDDKFGRIHEVYDDWGRENQMSLLVGSDVADIEKLVKYYLPKPAIDFASNRMAEILNKRYIQVPKSGDSNKEEA